MQGVVARTVSYFKKIALVDWCGLSWRGTSLEAGRPDCRLP